jgi:RNA polymerase sigma-70 factor (ECF subfamily)
LLLINRNSKFDKKIKSKVSHQDAFLEKILVEKLKEEGSKNAFSAIFILYYKSLVLFATNYTHGTELAEEIVEDVFVRIWEEHEVLDIKVSLKAYLLKAVRNKCIDWLRQAEVRRKYKEEYSSNILTYDFITDNYIFNSELESLIRAALDKLPAEIAQAYQMNRYEGLKYREIAEKLNVSVRTIEDRIGKALCLLRDELHDYLIQ